ncbi:MAG: enoyl-CoA hydratase/isomerase family protein [Gammaproteobacteria bacterium]|nr:enoyl-CoA hydratase/isomerase family protein [Gammaproteobacteria bacterium]
MSSEVLQRDRRGAVELLRIDINRSNSLDRAAIAAMLGALEDAEANAESQVLLLTGRPGIFCSGLDPAALASEGDVLREDMHALLRRLLGSRLRVVVCVTGHALGAGAALLLTADVRVSAKGPFKIGFPEVGQNQPLSDLTIALARQRLDRRAFEGATLLGRLYAPDEAMQAGFVDWIEGAGRALKAATASAEQLALLPEAAYVNALAQVRKDLL